MSRRLVNLAIDLGREMLVGIRDKLEKIMATQAELAAGLKAVNEKLKKIGGETAALLKKVDDLDAQIKNNPVSAEVQAAFDEVKTQAGVLDDMVPDEPAPPVPPPQE